MFVLASLFFVTYEAMKRLLGAKTDGSVQSPFIYMTAASFGEIVCEIRFFDRCQYFNFSFL
jgi:solute carrier family 25 S-adenosylmethionine transporter 26